MWVFGVVLSEWVTSEQRTETLVGVSQAEGKVVRSVPEIKTITKKINK